MRSGRSSLASASGSCFADLCARAELDGERGKQFDPAVVDVFLGLLDERPWA